MEIHWMCRATRSGPADRGTLICWKELGDSRMMRVRFVPDKEGEEPQDFELAQASEPVVGEDTTYDGVAFRVYARSEVAPGTIRIAPVTKVTVKMPVRTS